MSTRIAYLLTVAIRLCMVIKSPDWHLYRAFLLVVKSGSLSGAARQLGMTQPTVGRQVAALETAHGVTLFARSSDGLEPTDAGLRLVAAAEAMASAAEAASRAVSGEIDQERGTVRITASEMVGVEVLPSMLASFGESHPRIKLELALTNRNEDLLRGDADIAVRMVRPVQQALVAKRIGRIEIGLYAHRRYLKTHAVPGKLADLAQHVLIGVDRDATYLPLLRQFGDAISRDTFAFRSDSDLAQLAAVRAGFGIGVCQIGIARRDVSLVPMLHRELVFPLDIWLAMHRDQRTSRRIRLLFDHLAGSLAKYSKSSRAER